MATAKTLTFMAATMAAHPTAARWLELWEPGRLRG